MIAKELDPFSSTDRLQVAGRKAEEQMAFYLRRYFASSEDICVINGLKLFANGESAQFDHLIVHPNGIIIIESKSVASKITVTADNQWIREYGEKSTGMKSPIIQAEMQKMVFLEFAKYFSQIPSVFLGDNVQILVAISDGGIINWSNRPPIANVLKADQICSAAISLINSTTSKQEDIVDSDDLFQWFLDNMKKGEFKQIPGRNWVPWLALFLSVCNEYKDDLQTLASPDESLDANWALVDDQTKRQIILELMPLNYNAKWDSTVGKWYLPFHSAYLTALRELDYKLHGPRKSIRINIKPRAPQIDNPDV